MARRNRNPRPCAVCEHPEREAIDAELAKPWPRTPRLIVGKGILIVGSNMYRHDLAGITTEDMQHHRDGDLPSELLIHAMDRDLAKLDRQLKAAHKRAREPRPRTTDHGMPSGYTGWIEAAHERNSDPDA